MAGEEAVVSAFLQVLSTRAAAAVAAAGELTLPSGSHSEIKRLSRSIQKIATVIRDAEVKQRQNKKVRAWLHDVKDIAYDADEVFDMLSLRGHTEDNTLDSAEEPPTAAAAGFQKHPAPTWCLFLSCSRGPNPVVVSKIARELKAVRERLDKIARKRCMLGLRASSGIIQKTEARSRSPVETFSVLGRDEEYEKLIELLLDADQPDLSVIPIVGRGGVGKTTLARLIYDDEIVVRHFDKRIWVCGSEASDHLGKIATLIGNWEPMNSIITFEEQLDDQLFLIVIDGVENEKVEWETLCSDLNVGRQGSKIVITTRSEKITTRMETVRNSSCRLGGLAAEDSRLLFRECAFVEGKSGDHSELEAIGKKIVEKLKGFPLSIRMIGYLCSSNLEQSHWNAILDNHAWKLPGDGDDTRVQAAIRLSYHHLPPHLQQCFSYCSVFPKHHNFDKDELIWMWMAQGLLLPREGDRMEDIGSDWFDDLWRRHFLQSYAGKYIMHNLVHDLAQSVSKDEFLRIIEAGESPKIFKKTRHLLLCTDQIRSVEFMDPALFHRLHTVLLYRTNDLSFDLNSLFIKLRFIRVLCLSIDDIEELPDSINLQYLRYLDLADTALQELPESLCSLYNLETLRLNDILLRPPQGMSKLISLRHLEASSTFISSIAEIGKLTALQELSFFSIKDKRGHMIEELKDLTELRGELRINGLNYVTSGEEAKGAQLISKEYLQKLGLEWYYNYNWDGRFRKLDDEVIEGLRPHSNLKGLTIKNYSGAKFPSWLKNQWLSNLETIALYNCFSLELALLGELRFLKSLQIEGDAMSKLAEESLVLPEWEEREVMEDFKLFPNLHELRISFYSRLRRLPPLPQTLKELYLFDVGLIALPRLWGCEGLSSSSLSSLHISRCHELTSLREGLLQQHLPALESLTISDCPQLVSMPVDGLRTFVSLKSLVIENCNELIFLPEQEIMEDLKLFPNLQDLKISSCSKLRRLPPLPPTLKELYIHETGLVAIPRLWGCEELSSSSSSSLSSIHISSCNELNSLHEGLLQHHLRALESLSIIKCGGLVSWPEKGLHSLVSLKTLVMKDCSGLTFSPESGSNLPSSLVDLTVVRCPGITHEKFFLGLSNLTSLFLSSLPSPPPYRRGRKSPSSTFLSPIPTSLSSTPRNHHPTELVALPSLRRLKVAGCSNLILPSLSEGEGPLPLQYLEIENNSLKFLTAEFLRRLTFLEELRISNCSELIAFPREVELALCSLATLKSLVIDGCPSLQSLPGELGSLPLLDQLCLLDCHGIESLPEKGLPASLTSLVINCRGLSIKDFEEGGKEQTKIAGILLVEIDSRRIKNRGSSD